CALRERVGPLTFRGIYPSHKREKPILAFCRKRSASLTRGIRSYLVRPVAFRNELTSLTLRLRLAATRWGFRLPFCPVTLTAMEVNLRPETESRLQELAQKTGRPPAELLEDAMAGYLKELGDVRNMLDSRYDDLKSGRVRCVDGETAFAELRGRSEKRRARP